MYEREADGEDDAAESRTDKGTEPSYVESAATASVPLGGFRADAAAPEEPPVHRTRGKSISGNRLHVAGEAAEVYG